MSTEIYLISENGTVQVQQGLESGDNIYIPYDDAANIDDVFVAQQTAAIESISEVSMEVASSTVSEIDMAENLRILSEASVITHLTVPAPSDGICKVESDIDITTVDDDVVVEQIIAEIADGTRNGEMSESKTCVSPTIRLHKVDPSEWEAVLSKKKGNVIVMKTLDPTVGLVQEIILPVNKGIKQRLRVVKHRHLTSNMAVKKAARSITTSEANKTAAQYSGLTGERVHVCSVCDKGFPGASSLKRHSRIHTGERPYCCQYCNKSFSQSDHLKRHILSHMPSHSLSCTVCGKKYAEKNRLAIHMRIHTGERPFACMICERAFTYKEGLHKHMKIHSGERKYECEDCLKTFTEAQALKVHRRIHTGERPFLCRMCDKTFTSKRNLRVHCRTHTGERPYECSICFRTFVTKSALNTHHKIHDVERAFACSMCERAFNQKAALRIHMRMHMSKPFKCVFGACEKQFKRSRGLIGHIRVCHESSSVPSMELKNEKSNSPDLYCSICDKSFSMKDAYRFHLQIHEEERLGLGPNFSALIKVDPNSVMDDGIEDMDVYHDCSQEFNEMIKHPVFLPDSAPEMPDRGNSFVMKSVLEKHNRLPVPRERRRSV